MLRLLASTCALTVVLAGCTASPEETGDDVQPSVPPELVTVASNRSIGCIESVALVPVSFAHANNLLPDGFTAADVSTTFGLAAPAGTASALIFVVRCEEHDWGEDPLVYGGVSIGVEAPSYNNVDGKGEIHFYVFESYGTNPQMMGFLRGIGWAVVSTNATLDHSTAGPVQIVDSAVDGDSGYDISVQAPASTTSTAVYRSWQVTDLGVAYVDHIPVEVPTYLGQVDCSFRGRAAEVAGTTDCASEDTAGILLVGDWGGEYHLIQPEAAA